jgi:hypothetical protein
MAVCECAACGHKFSGLKAFDRHQDVNYLRCPAVVCLDPAAAGLVAVRGRWGIPLDAASRERLSTLRAKQAPAHTQT